MTVQRDYRGGAIVSVVLREQPDYSIVAAGGMDYIESIHGYRPRVEVIELLHTDESFEEVVRVAQRITQVRELQLLDNTNKMHLVVDNTDGSAKINELLSQFRGLDSMSITLTAEREQRYHSGQYHVPRRDVIADLVDAFQSGRIEVSEELTLSRMLESELTNLMVRTADEASPLIVAVALLAWKAEKELPYAGSIDHNPPPEYDPLRWGLSG